VRRSSPTALEAAASPVRAWQEDIRSAAKGLVLPGPGDLLPALQVGLLLEPIDLAALIGPPEPASSPEGSLAAPTAHHWAPAGLRSATRPPRMPPRRAVPTPAARLPADAGAPAPRSGWSLEQWPSSPGRFLAPELPAVPGAGAARLAAVLQRFEAQEAAAPSSLAAAGNLTPRALPEGSPPRSDRAQTGPSRRKPASPASIRGSRAFGPRPAGSAMVRGRLDADARGRTALASMQDVISGRLRGWSQGIDVPPLPNLAHSGADVARPTEPPATRPPSPGYSGALGGGALREAGLASARRHGPAGHVPASRNLAKLFDLVEQAAGDIAAVERRLAEFGAREAPHVQWLDDDELAGRLQGILARQARQRGIDLS
jgi:hypothetical protein